MYNANGVAENTIIQLLSVIFIVISVMAATYLLKTTTDETTEAIEVNGNNTIELMQVTKDKLTQLLT